MAKILELALPVMLHSDSEVPVFLGAKERLENMGRRYGVLIEVGAFLPYMPNSSRRQEAFDKQAVNQAKYKLPIMLVETGIQRHNGLTYVSSDPTYNPSTPSDIDKVIDQVGLLRDLDQNPRQDLVVAPHVGALVIPSMQQGDFSKPGFYSVADFLRLRNQLYDAAKKRFAELQSRTKNKGLVLALENAYPACFESFDFYQGGSSRFALDYQVFNDIESLRGISGDNLVLDLAHLVAVRDLPNQFARQTAISPGVLFETVGVSSWEDFLGRIGEIKDYLPHSRALHLSQTEGIGVRMKDASIEEAGVWGGKRRTSKTYF